MCSFTTSAVLLGSLALTGLAQAAGFAGPALVNEDASLSVAHRRVALWGIHIPRTTDECQPFLRPADCGAPAVLALRQKLVGEVRCEPLQEADGLTQAQCFVAAPGFACGLDLGAWLVEQGWAMPLAEAPVAYQVLGRLARDTGRGVWGMAGALQRSVGGGGL